MAAVAALLAAFTPYVYDEFESTLPHRRLIGPTPSEPVAGRRIDDYFVVESIDSNTHAIGEPRYYQGDYN